MKKFNKRKYGKRMGIEKAVDRAIDEMPEDFEIRIFLIGNRAEVNSMCITEYNEAEVMQMFEEDGRRKGIKEGLNRGIGEQNKASEIAEKMIRSNEPGDKIMLYTGLGKRDVNKLAGELHTVVLWNTVE